jgi:GNAT superfamily N-acetyltransferase
MDIMSGFSIRPMRKTDIDSAFNLSCSEGWNQTIDDWNFLIGNRSNTCIVAEHENKTAGTATAILHDGRVAWIGMVLVDKSLRGHGAGRKILERILSELSGIQVIKLDATQAGEPLYSSLGFVPEYRLFRMTCRKLNTGILTENVTGIQKTDPGNIESITAFDTPRFGVNRKGVIGYLASNYQEKGFYVSTGTETEGFIQGRDGSKFVYIGPLTALSDDIAISLLSESLRFHAGKPIALDIPESKPEIILWLEKAGFEKQRHFTRMYLKSNLFPGIPEEQYLISGPEFG